MDRQRISTRLNVHRPFAIRSKSVDKPIWYLSNNAGNHLGIVSYHKNFKKHIFNPEQSYGNLDAEGLGDLSRFMAERDADHAKVRNIQSPDGH